MKGEYLLSGQELSDLENQIEESDCDNCRLDFAQADWHQLDSAQRCKFFGRDGLIINIREYTKTDDETDDSWCRAKHIGYIIDGEAEFDFGIRQVIFRAGDGLFIPAGTKHRMLILSPRITIFYIDEQTTDQEEIFSFDGT